MRQSLSEYDDRDDGFSLAGDHRGEAPATPSPDRRLPKILLTGGAMVIFAGGLWFAYVQGTHRVNPNTTVQADGVPLLKSDGQPTKVKPDNPGGMTVPNQNVSLYNDKPGSQVEKLLPPAEKPMPKPVAPPPPPPPPAPSAASPPSVAPGPGQPVVPPDAAQAKGAPKPVIPPTKAPATAAATPPKAEPATAAAKPGGVSVRVGSVRSPEAAKDEWSRLKRENSDILGSLKANAVRADLGDKGIYYRIEAGPFSDAAAAEKLCSEMKRRSLGCILAR